MDAARAAGFASRSGDTLFLIPEPEAAAISVFKSISEEAAVKHIGPGDGVVICDCGVSEQQPSILKYII
jgi:actin-like ATPase involved in cell morphogenesis